MKDGVIIIITTFLTFAITLVLSPLSPFEIIEDFKKLNSKKYKFHHMKFAKKEIREMLIIRISIIVLLYIFIFLVISSRVII